MYATSVCFCPQKTKNEEKLKQEHFLIEMFRISGKSRTLAWF